MQGGAWIDTESPPQWVTAEKEKVCARMVGSGTRRLDPWWVRDNKGELGKWGEGAADGYMS